MANKPTRVEGVDYSPESIENARLELAVLRNGALEQTEFKWAVLLSHVLAYLADYKEYIRLEDEIREMGEDEALNGG
jgi:hypothetical protein